MSVLQLKSLNAKEQKAFSLHMLFSLIEGGIKGVLVLNEFVFLKSLQGSDYQLGFLFQFSVLVFVFLIFINEFIRRNPYKRKVLRVTGILTRLPLLLLFFFPRDPEVIGSSGIYHIIFLGIFLIFFLYQPVVLPIINLLLKHNYRPENFGRLYSYGQTIHKITMLLVTFGYGFLLDTNNFAFTYIWPVMGMLGIFSIYMLSLIDYKPIIKDEPKRPFMSNVKTSITSMADILRKHKAYLHFEISFLFYGFAFMSSATVIVLFFDKELGLNYSSMAFYKNSYNILAILLLPLFGRLIGRLDPRRYGIITYSSILIFIFFVILTELFPSYTTFLGIDIYYLLIGYIVFHGIFAASMPLLWNIGSAYFCSNEDADTYQAVHLSLTGLRAIFSPLLGVFFYQQFGFTVTFLIGMLALGIGILILYYSEKNVKNLTLKKQSTESLVK
ncbi:MAG: MFS transporter [Bacteroidota bacterium]